MQYSKQQKIIRILIFEVEYILMSQEIREDIQIQQFINKLLPSKAVIKINILNDNKIRITLTKNFKNQN